MKTQKVKTLHREKVKQLQDALRPNNADWYTVDGVKYLREDLVNQKMDGIMERIAKALETQTEWLMKNKK